MVAGEWEYRMGKLVRWKMRVCKSDVLLKERMMTAVRSQGVRRLVLDCVLCVKVHVIRVDQV